MSMSPGGGQKASSCLEILGGRALVLRLGRILARSCESSALHEQVQDVPAHVASRAEQDRRYPTVPSPPPP